MYRGTYRANRRQVHTTAPDCLVYINGETSLPSGANPNRRVDIQPFVNSVNVTAGITGGSGSASLSLHIPSHHMNDLYTGGQLAITTMMEVKIYMKGHFTVGGAPRYYPVFWGLTTSVNESYSAGEHTVELSCSDMLHWWNIQQVNVNPSWLEATENQQARFNLEGNAFTGKNPFSIMYTLARRVYGDSMNVRNSEIPNQHFRSEPSPSENLQLQAYWSARLGRVANSLRMYGPTGQVLQGDLLDYVIDPNGFRKTNRGRAAMAEEAEFFEPFKQGDVNFAAVSPFSKIYSQLQSFEMSSNEFETKLNLANMVKDALGYEFFMDVTGEIVFKPPFYNLDVRPNFPVSWIRDIDVISWNFAENEPDVTFLEATGFRFANRGVGLSSEVQPHATYVDYRLVQKYGWRPGSFSSEFIGSEDFGNQKALFYHLVDVMDEQNARVNNGTVTIPIRPELRLGYPVYIEGRDAYYYVESVTHTFSYGSRCTTQLTLKARRQKFYGAFDRWSSENQEPQPGDVTDPGRVPRHMYKRDLDPVSGTPQGDRNVIMRYFSDMVQENSVEAFEDSDSDTEVLRRNLVSLRSQFGIRGDNKYVYQIDPNRDQANESEDTGERRRGRIASIESDPLTDTDSQNRRIEVNAVILPVSDERGYEVIGAYEYGRSVTVSPDGFIFDKQESDVQVENLLFMEPDQGGGTVTPNVAEGASQQAPTTHQADPNKDQEFMVDPNNYGRLLTEVRPPNLGPTDLVGFAQTEAARMSDDPNTAPSSTPSTASSPRSVSNEFTGYGTEDPGIVRRSRGNRPFRYNSNVGQWRSLIREVRSEMGLSEEDYSDESILAIIHIESSGNPDARRTNSDGKVSQFVGLVQIGHANAADLGRSNTDFMGDARLSIRHYLEYQEEYRSRHDGDPQKQALLWKGGPGTLRQYNHLERTGGSAQQLDAWLSNYPPSRDNPWGIDEYLSQMEAARSVWEESLEDPPDIPEDLPIADARDLVDNAVSEAALASDQADDPLEAGIINVVGIPDMEEELAYERQLFEEKLQESVEKGIVGLPEGMKPPRDPSIAPVITKYLENLYSNAFGDVKDRERQLRGLSKMIPLAPNAASVPTANPAQERQSIDTPLGRSEIREALDSGQTYNELFDPGGVIDKLTNQIKDAADVDGDD